MRDGLKVAAVGVGRIGVFHAQHVQEIAGDRGDCVLAAVIDAHEDTAERAGALVRKQGLGRDPEVQVLEDTLCLVFLETQFTELAARLETEKLLDVTRKTLRKMSGAAVEEARGLDLDAGSRELLERALAPD